MRAYGKKRVGLLPEDVKVSELAWKGRARAESKKEANPRLDKCGECCALLPANSNETLCSFCLQLENRHDWGDGLGLE